MLRLKVIACDVLNREISLLSSQSRCYVDVTFLHQGLHDTPEKLRVLLQQEIDKANSGFPYNYYNTVPDYDYILVGYGLCSNGIAGISSRRIPLVIPRGHDCITLLLGSKETYRCCFQDHPGTYWFSAGWIERGWQPSELKYKVLYEEYSRKYGEENAEYLMTMEQHWMKDYRQAAYICWDILNNSEYYRKFTQDTAKYLAWNYLEIQGKQGLLQRVLNGVFNDSEVLVVPPEKKVIPSYDDSIITFE
ncbi:Hypothetical protein LUCI_2875 [Lucifera butyrica]|uniref:DUF1638 domain-containing protein n=1 Tax=Lucifera butyrica TaxID=1351585 RepID=A0A498R9J1_9FIRM|nr:DUF1638 domain-containing protein [Lucifera butyrica]VBB07610.1 Hypothetical protein LUCI_2875 [Lucifera butyrica]